MRTTGLAFETWDVVPSYIVRLEPDREAARIVCGNLASRIVWISVLPQYKGATPPTEEWLNGVKDGTSSLDEWLSPITEEPGSYLLQDGVKAIFKDVGIQTHNGFPQAHITGPAVLIDESVTSQ